MVIGSSKSTAERPRPLDSLSTRQGLSVTAESLSYRDCTIGHVSNPNFRVSCPPPVCLSARETTEKAIKCIRQAAENDAKVVVFPKAFIPAFPPWNALRPPTENHDLFERMAKESVYADGDEIQALRDVARETKTVISIGFSEKVHFSAACLYNSNILIGTGGEILVHHRKLMPTFYEKLTWSPGDGHGLRVAKTEYGHIGNLICGENKNPLARYSLMAQGERIHISTWPAIWPTRVSTRE